MEDPSFYWPYVSTCCSCLSLLVTVGASATPAERNLYHQEEYYNSNHDAGTVVEIDYNIWQKLQYQAEKQELISSSPSFPERLGTWGKSDPYLKKFTFLWPRERS